MNELSKLAIEERRTLNDDLWDSDESELDAASVSEDVGTAQRATVNIGHLVKRRRV